MSTPKRFLRFANHYGGSDTELHLQQTEDVAKARIDFEWQNSNGEVKRLARKSCLKRRSSKGAEIKDTSQRHSWLRWGDCVYLWPHRAPDGYKCLRQLDAL